MRTRRGLGPAPRPQPDNSARAPPQLRPSPAGSPRGSRGAEAQRPPGPMPPCPATQPEVTVQPERRRHCVQIRLPGRARPLPPGGRARSTVATRNWPHLQTWASSILPWPVSTSGSPTRLQVTLLSSQNPGVHRKGLLHPNILISALGN